MPVNPTIDQLFDGIPEDLNEDEVVRLLVAPGRECGGCTVCCVAPHVEELRKPAGTPCSYLKQSCDGCDRYHNQPSVCRGYLCTYLMGLTEVWPASTNLAFTLQPDDQERELVLMVGHGVGDPLLYLENLAVVNQINEGLAMVDLVVIRTETGAICINRDRVILAIKVDERDPMKVAMDSDTEEVLGILQ